MPSMRDRVSICGWLYHVGVLTVVDLLLVPANSAARVGPDAGQPAAEQVSRVTG